MSFRPSSPSPFPSPSSTSTTPFSALFQSASIRCRSSPPSVAVMPSLSSAASTRASRCCAPFPPYLPRTSTSSAPSPVASSSTSSLPLCPSPSALSPSFSPSPFPATPVSSPESRSVKVSRQRTSFSGPPATRAIPLALVLAALLSVLLCLQPVAATVCKTDLVPATFDATLGKPTPSTAVVQDDNTAIVSWAPAAGASSVESYLVTLIPVCEPAMLVNSAVRALKFENLDPHITYNFSVSPISSAGIGEASDHFTIPKLSVPDEYCGVDTAVNGMTIISLFIGLLLGAALGVVMAQILPSKSEPAAAAPASGDPYKANPMLDRRK